MKCCPPPGESLAVKPKDDEPLICRVSKCTQCDNTVYRNTRETGCCEYEGPPDGSLLVADENPTYILKGFPVGKPE